MAESSEPALEKNESIKKVDEKVDKTLDTFKNTSLGKKLSDKVERVYSKEIHIASILGKTLVNSAVCLVVYPIPDLDGWANFISYTCIFFLIFDNLVSVMTHFKPMVVLANASLASSSLKILSLLILLIIRSITLGKLFFLVCLQFMISLACYDLVAFLISRIRVQHSSLQSAIAAEEAKLKTTNPEV